MTISSEPRGKMRQHSLTVSTDFSNLGCLSNSPTSRATNIKIKLLSSDKVLLNLTPTWSCQFRAYFLRISQRQNFQTRLTKISTPEITALTSMIVESK